MGAKYIYRDTPPVSRAVRRTTEDSHTTRTYILHVHTYRGHEVQRVLVYRGAAATIHSASGLASLRIEWTQETKVL